MRAVGLLTHGGPDVLQVVELPEGHAGLQNVLDVRSVVRAPTGKTHSEACGLPMNGLTARQSLDLLKLRSSR